MFNYLSRRHSPTLEEVGHHSAPAGMVRLLLQGRDEVERGRICRGLGPGVGDVARGVEMLSRVHRRCWGHPQPLAARLEQGHGVEAQRLPGSLPLLVEAAYQASATLPHRGLHPPQFLSRGQLALIFCVLEDEVTAPNVDTDAHQEILLGTESLSRIVRVRSIKTLITHYLNLSVSLDTEPECWGLTRPEADHLEVSDPELLLGQVEIGPGHQAAEGHADLEVQLLSGVH